MGTPRLAAGLGWRRGRCRRVGQTLRLSRASSRQQRILPALRAAVPRPVLRLAAPHATHLRGKPAPPRPLRVVTKTPPGSNAHFRTSQAVLLSNSLYLAAFSHYVYVTFLGYSGVSTSMRVLKLAKLDLFGKLTTSFRFAALPFLQHTQRCPSILLSSRQRSPPPLSHSLTLSSRSLSHSLSPLSISLHLSPPHSFFLSIFPLPRAHTARHA